MNKPACPECGRKTTVSMGFFAATGEDAWYCPHCNKIQPIPDRHQRQWTICPYCGGEMIIDSNCENCEITNDDRLIPDEEMSPEEAFHDMRRVDWEREVYRRADEEDRAEHMPHSDEPVSDNWFDYEDDDENQD